MFSKILCKIKHFNSITYGFLKKPYLYVSFSLYLRNFAVKIQSYFIKDVL